MVKTPRTQCRGHGSSPWSGNWLPHAASKRFLAPQLRPGTAKLKKKKKIGSTPLGKKALGGHWGSRAALLTVVSWLPCHGPGGPCILGEVELGWAGLQDVPSAWLWGWS